ncbi:hypothetical protein BDP27DRAFT_1328518 [Rhodocollybia butyracea]|uniref:F-box domain-containing protein n=1 Tax=Rhodocollybia butyracea TaxID=206335 RepID=A0A9P5PSF7_9AGAR|nr:hypothetical protein BDP27DRAFT_1328518 [Rhodocollybia butyracea]
MAKYLTQSRIEGPIWLGKDEISFLRAKVSDTETGLKNLKTRKFRLTLQRRKDELKKLKNILSPIRRLPLEVLSEIFVLSCHDDGFRDSPADIDTVQYTPFTISSVCVAWKTVVHDTPKIWSVLHLQLDDTSKDQAWVQRWLSRSRGIPLELHLQFRHQIRILDFWGPPEAIVALFRLPSSSIPLLEELSLTLKSFTISRPLKWNIAHSPPSGKMEFLLGSPALQVVKIVECSDISIISKSLIPFAQLTSLKIDHAHHLLKNPDRIVNLLQQCSNIVVLEICMPLGQQFSPASPILLPLLQSLAIRSGGNDMSPLCHISAPFLEDLSLSCPHNLAQNHHRLCEEVLDFQQRRSSPTLSSLTIREIKWMDKEVVSTLLPAFPSIRLFRMVNVGPKADLFKCLTLKVSKYDNPKAIVLPHLTHLEVLGLYSHGFPFWERELLCDMLLSRWWTESEESDHNGLNCLRKVTFDQQSKLYDEEIARISGLAGLEVTVLPISHTK